MRPRRPPNSSLLFRHCFVIRPSSFVIPFQRFSSGATEAPFVIRHSILFIGFALATALGQESPTPSPTPSPTVASTPTPSAPPVRNVVLRFALPPLDGTISLGIYDASGTLVRVLHREDTLDDFTADALQGELE